jgi:hypothetical protein
VITTGNMLVVVMVPPGPRRAMLAPPTRSRKRLRQKPSFRVDAVGRDHPISMGSHEGERSSFRH